MPVVAIVAWLYFWSLLVVAYDLEKEGVVASGEVIRMTTHRTKSMIVSFTTADGERVEADIRPKSCDLKQPGDPIQIRYLPESPTDTQDACDTPRSHFGGQGIIALLVGVVFTGGSGWGWRMWWRHRKAGYIPMEQAG